MGLLENCFKMYLFLLNTFNRLQWIWMMKRLQKSSLQVHHSIVADTMTLFLDYINNIYLLCSLEYTLINFIHSYRTWYRIKIYACWLITQTSNLEQTTKHQAFTIRTDKNHTIKLLNLFKVLKKSNLKHIKSEQTTTLSNHV